MFSEKSLRAKFLAQLAFASLMLTLVFSVVLYQYIKITIYEHASSDLMVIAKNSLDSKFLKELNNKFTPLNSKVFIKIEPVTRELLKPKFRQIKENNKTQLYLFYPLENSRNLILKQDITQLKHIADQILVDIVMINAFMIFLIVFYALFLSRMLLIPIKLINNKLSSVDERFLTKIDKKEIPDEFMPLLNNINRLIERIQTFVMYQKELFIGVAHELKTPLAVMKTKNEVTLLKRREPDAYIEALKQSNESINNMNKMITSILEIGRQEGDQFEEAQKIDIIKYLKEISRNFQILAKKDGKNLIENYEIQSLILYTQKTLLLHIIQNFLQNAIKFSDIGSSIFINTKIVGNFLEISVFNYGKLLDPQIDYFAPFKRYGDKSGAGLGLFLAKNAAQALKAEISLHNSKNNDGVVGTLRLQINSKFKNL